MAAASTAANAAAGTNRSGRWEQRRTKEVAIRIRIRINTPKAAGKCGCNGLISSISEKDGTRAVLRAVVVIVTVAVTAALLLGVTEVGETEHVDAVGWPVQLRDTG